MTDNAHSQLVGERDALRREVEALRRDADESRRIERLLREALDSFTDQVVFYDRDERVVFTNDRFHQVYTFLPPKNEIVGYTQEQLLRLSIENGLYDVPEASADPDGWIASRMAERRGEQALKGAIGEVKHASGRTFMFRHRLTSDGGLIRMLTDITEQKKLEENLRRAHAEMEQRVEERTRTLSAEIRQRKQIEEKLKESEQRFKDFAEAASDWMWETDADLRFTFVSARFTELSGLGPETFIGKRRWEVIKGDADAEDLRRHQADLEARRPFRDFRYNFTDGEGRQRFGSVSGNPVLDDDGKFLGYRGVGSDITAEMEAQNALRESEAQLDEALEAMSEGFAYFDAEDRLVRCNSKHLDLFPSHAKFMVPGVRFEELLRRQIENTELSWAVGREEEWIAERIKAHRNPGKPTEQEFATGRIIRLSEYKTKSGGIVCIRSDITELKETERSLSESEARLKQAAELARLGSWVWDVREERCTYASEQMASLLGVSQKEYLSRTSTAEGSLSFVHPNDRDWYRENFRELRGGSKIDFEYRVVTGTGEVRFAREIAVPVFDENGAVVQESGTYQDITELKRAEEQLRQAQKMDAIGQLTGGVAHDFNNLLAVIMGNGELLGERIGKDNAILQNMLRAAMRGAELTQRLLAFSRKQMLESEVIDANALIDATTDLLRRTLEEHIDVETVTGDGLWNCEVDPTQLENALVNLAINARDAMPNGGKLTIETANVRLDDEYAAAQAEVEPGEYVMLAVTDTGSGMPPEVKGRVFEPFFTTKAVGQGTGLGLSMIYGFAKQSGGHVTIYSELNEGTTVKLYLPRSTESRTEKRKPVSDRAPLAQGETVLVVEDNEDVRALTVELLNSLGYRVMEAATAESAFERLSSATGVDLLLTDVVLSGGMNGRELAEQAGRDGLGIKVLYMSGYTENAIVHHGRLDTDAELLQKPFRKADLARAVRRVLDG